MSGNDRDRIYNKNKNKRTTLRFYLDNVVVNAAILPVFKKILMKDKISSVSYMFLIHVLAKLFLRGKRFIALFTFIGFSSSDDSIIIIYSHSFINF